VENLTKFERDALLLVSVGAVEIRALARSLPDSEVRSKILAIADGMHNIPAILAGEASERQANAELVGYGIRDLQTVLGRNQVFG
jgi:hypothetical protein